MKLAVKFKFRFTNRFEIWCYSRDHESNLGVVQYTIENPIVEIKLSYDRLISTMGFAILVNDIFILNQGPVVNYVWHVLLCDELYEIYGDMTPNLFLWLKWLTVFHTALKRVTRLFFVQSSWLSLPYITGHYAHSLCRQFSQSCVHSSTIRLNRISWRPSIIFDVPTASVYRKQTLYGLWMGYKLLSFATILYYRST